MNNEEHILSQTDATQISHTCKHNIAIIKKGPANYRSIIGSGVKYTDNDFKANRDSIYWSDYPRPSGISLKN